MNVPHMSMFLTSVMEGDDWSASHWNKFSPEKELPYLLARRLGETRSCLDVLGKTNISRHAV